jgi:hypothetical protein
MQTRARSRWIDHGKGTAMVLRAYALLGYYCHQRERTQETAGRDSLSLKLQFLGVSQVKEHQDTQCPGYGVEREKWLSEWKAR